MGCRGYGGCNSFSNVHSYAGEVNAIFDISPVLPHEPFQHASREVNEWRGRCLHLLGQVEAAITDCLLSMSKVPGRGGEVRLQHLIGQRYEELAKAISSDGPFRVEGGKVSKAFSKFRESDFPRNMLCHATSEIALNEKGEWVAIFRHIRLKAGEQIRAETFVTRKSADDIQKQLSRQARSLCDRLTDLRANLDRIQIEG